VTMRGAEEVTQRVVAAWAGLAGAERMTALQVLVRPKSMLCPTGWVGVVRIHEWVTAIAPTEHLASVVADALTGLAPMDTTSPDLLRTRLPAMTEVLGRLASTTRWVHSTPYQTGPPTSSPRQGFVGSSPPVPTPTLTKADSHA
jgi:hypothetical protein